VYVDRGTGREKISDPNVNPYSSTCIINFAQTNLHTSSPSAGGNTMPNPYAQPLNHFHSRTTNEDSSPSLGMPQQAMDSMYGQGYTHTAPSFTMPNPSLTHHTSRFNGQAYPNPDDNFQAPYTTITYTDPVCQTATSCCL
jgi:hypothetical protein